MKAGYIFDVFVGNSVVDMYAKRREIGDARKTFDEMSNINIVYRSGMIYMWVYTIGVKIRSV